MLTQLKQKKLFTVSFVAAVAALAAGTWLSRSDTAHAAPIKSAALPVVQQVGYAGQLSPSVTGQLPVTFRFFNVSGQPAFEETITADIQQGRFQVFIGQGQKDLQTTLKDSQQLKVFFQGNLVDTVSVVHADKDDIAAHPAQFAGRHAVILTNETSRVAAIPAALVGTCSIVNSGFTTVPFTNTTVGIGTPSCGANFAVSGGYSFLTLPSQGVIVFGLFPVASTNWQINYQVGGTAATVQTTAICCQ
jgi:hypothetical protein